MSGVVKGIKKVFKAVGKVIKKVIKPLLIVAAVYFTAGLALSAFPATAGFAASLPGFAGGGTLGLGIGAGKVAGTGIFTKVAAKIGLGTLGKAGGLVGGALSKGTSAALLGANVGTTALVAGTAKATASGAIGATTGAAAGVAGGGKAITALGAEGAASAAGAGVAKAATAGSAVTSSAAATTGMSLTEKLLLAQMGTKTIGAFLAPTDDEVATAQKKWRGAFYGADASDKSAGAPQAPIGAQAPRVGRPLFGQPQTNPQPPAQGPQGSPFGARSTPESAPGSAQPLRALLPAEPGAEIDAPFQYGRA